MSAPDSSDGGASYRTVTVSCSGPGPVYQPGSGRQSSPCSFEWRWPSTGYDPAGTYPFTVTVTYRVSWGAVGAPGGGVLQGVEVSATVPVRVGEIEGLGT